MRGGTTSERCYEDFAVGQEFRTGGYTFTESEIIDFALKFDPQPFHIDVTAAAKSHFGGLVASGWQVGAIAFRLFAQLDVFGDAAMGGFGIDEMRMRSPVRPGDTIHTVARVLEMRTSATRPDRGYAIFQYEGVNQRGETAVTLRATQILRRRGGIDAVSA